MELPYKQVHKFVWEASLCFKCLGGGHIVKDCMSNLVCKQCDQNHATAWHGKKKAPIQLTCNGTGIYKQSKIPSGITSMIVPVYIDSSSNSESGRVTYALLDTKADACFATSAVLEGLHTRRRRVQLKIATMTNSARSISCLSHSGLRLKGLKDNKWVPLPEVYERAEIPANREHIPTPETAARFSHLKCIKRKLSPLKDVEIGILVGYNCPEAIAPLASVVGEGAQPYAVKTALGWSVVGQTGAAHAGEEGTHRRIMKTHCVHGKFQKNEDDGPRRYARLNGRVEGDKYNEQGYCTSPLPFQEKPEAEAMPHIETQEIVYRDGEHKPMEEQARGDSRGKIPHCTRCSGEVES